MTIQEVKQFIEDNKDSEEVKQYLGSFAVEPTVEVFKEKIQTDSEFKSFMDSEKDKHHSKALETWKENNLDPLVDAKVKELYPEQDPKDIEMNKLKQEIEQIKIDANRKDMTNLALQKASELNLPADLVGYLVSSDEATTLANIEKFNNSYTEGIQSTVKAKLEGNGDVIPRGNGIDTITSDVFFKMDLLEQQKYAEEYPEAYENIIK